MRLAVCTDNGSYLMMNISLAAVHGRFRYVIASVRYSYSFIETFPIDNRNSSPPTSHPIPQSR